MRHNSMPCQARPLFFAAITSLVVALSITGCTTPPANTQALKSGEQVYQETCAACHSTGVNGAPRFQDTVGWKKLLEEGQVLLSAHGWVGIRGMPPQGGNPHLSVEEFSRAVAYMGRSVGGEWHDPDAEMLEEIHEEIVLRRKELAQKPN